MVAGVGVQHGGGGTDRRGPQLTQLLLGPPGSVCPSQTAGELPQCATLWQRAAHRGQWQACHSHFIHELRLEVRCRLPTATLRHTGTWPEPHGLSRAEPAPPAPPCLPCSSCVPTILGCDLTWQPFRERSSRHEIAPEVPRELGGVCYRWLLRVPRVPSPGSGPRPSRSRRAVSPFLPPPHPRGAVLLTAGELGTTELASNCTWIQT